MNAPNILDVKRKGRLRAARIIIGIDPGMSTGIALLNLLRGTGGLSVSSSPVLRLPEVFSEIFASREVREAAVQGGLAVLIECPPPRWSRGAPTAARARDIEVWLSSHELPLALYSIQPMQARKVAKEQLGAVLGEDAKIRTLPGLLTRGATRTDDEFDAAVIAYVGAHVANS